MKLRTREFVESNPPGIRSSAQAYHLSSKRHTNGLASIGACNHVPGLGIIWDRDRWVEWLESQRS